MKRIIHTILASAAFCAVLLALTVPQVGAQNREAVCRGVEAAGGSCTDEGAETTVNDVIGLVVNILSIAVGVVAVIMIIVAGFKYVTSGGDSSNVQSAKNTIVYAIVGLVVAAMARAITGYVLGRLNAGGG
jgi:hypothetical protein